MRAFLGDVLLLTLSTLPFNSQLINHILLLSFVDEIRSQLGQGTYGKVVKCYDRTMDKFVAVKIIKAIPKYREAAKLEIKVLHTIEAHDPSNSKGCIHLRDVFEYRDHVCMVFDLLSDSVFDYLRENAYRPFPMSHIQDFGRQLFTSVNFLHGLTLVHTGIKV